MLFRSYKKQMELLENKDQYLGTIVFDTRLNALPLENSIMGLDQPMDIAYLFKTLQEVLREAVQQAIAKTAHNLPWTLNVSSQTMWGIFSAFADRHFSLHIDENQIAKMRTQVLDVLDMMSLPLQLIWITKWLSDPHAENDDDYTVPDRNSKVVDILHSILKQGDREEFYRGEKVITMGHPTIFRKRVSKRNTQDVKEDMFREYVDVTLYYLYVRLISDNEIGRAHV